MTAPDNRVYQEFPSNRVRRQDETPDRPSLASKILPLVAAFVLGMAAMFIINRAVSMFQSQGKGASTMAAAAASPLATAMPAAQVAVPAPSAPGAQNAGPANASAQPGQMTPQQIADKAKTSVVYIETQSISGETRAQGSGFCVAPGTFVTNYHVVENTKSIGARLVTGQTGLDAAVVLRADAEHDLALLRVPGLDAPVLPLQSTFPGVGDPIYTMSNPRGLEGTFTEGNVSAYRRTEKSNDPLMQITAPISPGSSGGPVLDRYGQVVAVVVATWKDAQNINFAVPAKHIQDLLSSSAAPSSSEAPTGQQTSQHVTLTPQELYYKGLQALDAGNKKAAMDVWNELSHLDKGLADRLMEAYQKSP